MDIDKFEIGFKRLMIVLFFISGIMAGYYQNWFIVAVSLTALILLIVTPALLKKLKLDFSSWLGIFSLVFIYASLFLGEIWNFYYKFWWWDLLLHTLFGFIIGLIGISMVYFMNSKEKKIHLNASFIAMFGFCFSVTLGVFWEFFEFFMDTTFGTTMLKSGLLDTIGDLIVNSFGAFVVAIIAFLFLKKDFRGIEKIFADTIKKM
jgi:hypothetical protein